MIRLSTIGSISVCRGANKDASRSNGLPVSCYKHRSSWKLHRSENTLQGYEPEMYNLPLLCKNFSLTSTVVYMARIVILHPQRLLYIYTTNYWCVCVRLSWTDMTLRHVYVAPIHVVQ